MASITNTVFAKELHKNMNTYQLHGDGWADEAKKMLQQKDWKGASSAPDYDDHASFFIGLFRLGI